MTSEEKRGTLAGLGCYVIWGFMPIYWKLLGEVDSLEIIAHRIIWCMVFTVALCFVFRMDFIALLKQRRAWKVLTPAAVLIALNWGIYIYAVNINHIVETSIGYYINPLMTIVFAVVLFKERLTKMQVIAVILCACGVAFFTISYGQFPWISLGLALTFAAYGAIKKVGGYPSAPSLAMEGIVSFVPALLFAFWLSSVGIGGAFMGDVTTVHGWVITLLLVGAGLASAVPLILFAKAATTIPLSLLGFIQYVSPTLALLVGVFGYGEAFTLAHAVCLGLIWTGLALVTAETLRKARR